MQSAAGPVRNWSQSWHPGNVTGNSHVIVPTTLGPGTDSPATVLPCSLRHQLFRTRIVLICFYYA